MTTQPWGNRTEFGVWRRADGRLDICPPGNLAFEPFHALERVEAEIIGKTPHKTHGIGAPRKGFEAVFFEGLQMILTNFQRARNGGEIVAPSQPRSTEILPDGLERCVGIAGNLAEVNPFAAEFATFVERQMSYFGHRTTNTAKARRYPAGYANSLSLICSPGDQDRMRPGEPAIGKILPLIS